MLCIDTGNTRTKIEVYKSDQPIHAQQVDVSTKTDLAKIIEQFNIKEAIWSSTGADYPTIAEWLDQELDLFISLSHETPLPIQIAYHTPHTLGRDRIALAVAGNNYFPENNVLVIDAGTCITYDYIDAQQIYHGGAIAPGIQMRFKALNHFTARLPLVPFDRDYDKLIGQNTQESILSGVLVAVISEMEGLIYRYFAQNQELKVLLTGGDATFLHKNLLKAFTTLYGKNFESPLKNQIFAFPNLVIDGLHQILKYNAIKDQ